MTLTNPQTFGFEFRLWSLPYASSRGSVSQPFSLLLAGLTGDPGMSKQMSTVEILAFKLGLYKSMSR